MEASGPTSGPVKWVERYGDVEIVFMSSVR